MFFEEFFPGQTFVTNSYRVTGEEIKEYALRYNPHPLHTDEEQAKKSRFKGIIAAGIHCLSIGMKLFINLNILGNENICGVSLDKVKFISPVYPDDILTAKVEVIDQAIDSEEKDKGLITFGISLKNQNDQVVLSFCTTGLIKCRPHRKGE